MISERQNTNRVRDERTPSTSSIPRWHVPQLDGLRGVAIATVFAGHILIAEGFTGALGAFATSLAGFGVSLFFSLSGYLITSLLLREEQASGGRIDLRGFYGRRFLRIFPAYFAYIATVWILDQNHLVVHVTAHDYLASALFARNLIGHAAPTGHLWSLSLEEQFYLLWPTAMVFTRPSERKRFTISVLGALTLWRLVVLHFGWFANGALYERTDLRFDTILAGCALAIYGVPKDSASLKTVPLLGVTLVALGASGLSIVNPRYCWFTYPILSTALVFILAGSVTNRGAWNTLLIHPALRWLGRISYSLYLWHALFIGNLSDFPGRFSIPVALGIPLSFACGVASYRWIEQPVVRLKNAWSRSRSNATVGLSKNASASRGI